MEILSAFTESIVGAKYAKFDNVGDVVGGTLVAHEERQAVDFATKEPKFWKDGNKMMEHVITVRQKDGAEVKIVIDNGAKKEALKNALRASGAPGFALGGKLVLKFSGTEPSKFGSDKKLYEAVYAAPVVVVT